MSRRRVVTVADLPNQDARTHPRAFLYCETCHGEYSAHRGDYFMAAPDHVMRCCRRPLRLVTRECRLVEVQS